MFWVFVACNINPSSGSIHQQATMFGRFGDATIRLQDNPWHETFTDESSPLEVWAFHGWGFSSGTYRGVARGAQFSGRRITAGAPKSPNNVTSTFSPAVQLFPRDYFRTLGRQTCFLPRAPSNLVKSLLSMQDFLTVQRIFQANCVSKIKSVFMLCVF